MADRIGVLKEGELIQIDPPEKIYNDPNSVYVATRLGSPKINVVPSDLLQMELPGQVAYVAFRPENVSLNSEGMFVARVETIQNLGVEEIVTMNFMDEMVRAVVRPESLSRTSKDVKFTVRKEDMLFFDSQSQRVYL
jgi:multiple sugar transport system ATP-binding protein